MYCALKSIREPRSFQHSGAIDYKSVHETKLQPYLTKIDNTGEDIVVDVLAYSSSPFVSFNFNSLTTNQRNIDNLLHLKRFL